MARRVRSALCVATLAVAALAWAGYAYYAQNRTAPERAFYYWRTTLALSDTEKESLRILNVHKLYVRLFDVEWSATEGARAIAKLALEPSPFASDVEIVPVVYLRNDVFAHLEPTAVEPLADLVAREASVLLARPGKPASELQLDCDWTDSTRERYFAFLRSVRSRVPAGTQLSATIRLHQIKFRERTGVPPVERGMLMFYNMGNFSADSDEHAIYDGEQAERYVTRLAEYPLPLDAALPIWSWTLQLRDEQVQGLLQSTDPGELPALDFLRRLSATRFEVLRTTFLHGHLLRAGDQLKGEVMTPEQIRNAATLLAAHLVSAPETVAIFDLSEKNLRRHDTASLQRVFETFR